MTGSAEGDKKSIEAGEALEIASPIAVEKYLKGIKFPADKDQLLDCAEQNNAPDSVLKAIEGLADINFYSPVEISKAIANE